MLKLILLAGIIAAGGVIGAAGVSQAKARRNALGELAQDIKTMQDLLVMQGMTLRDALCSAACGSSLGGAYKKLAQQLPKFSEEAEEFFRDIQAELSKSELTEQDGAILRDYICRLAESISAREITLAAERASAEAARRIAAVEEKELARAKVMQKVWLLAGIGIAVILI